jgi:hypothetical protein
MLIVTLSLGFFLLQGYGSSLTRDIVISTWIKFLYFNTRNQSHNLSPAHQRGN